MNNFTNQNHFIYGPIMVTFCHEQGLMVFRTTNGHISSISYEDGRFSAQDFLMKFKDLLSLSYPDCPTKDAIAADFKAWLIKTGCNPEEFDEE